MSNTPAESIALAWDVLPDSLRAHPGIKALHRAALAAAEAAQAQPESTPAGYNRPPSGEPTHPEQWNAGYEAGFADGKAAQAQPAAVPNGPVDDFGRPIIYNTEAIDNVTHALTGDDGEDDSVTVLESMARYVQHVWPGKSAMQVLMEYEEQMTAAQPVAAVPAGWISVKDRMPEPDSGEVLVWLTMGVCGLDEWHTHREDPTGMSTTHTLDMGCMWRTFDFEDVTHWMPLPAAPAQGEQQAQGGGHE